MRRTFLLTSILLGACLATLAVAERRRPAMRFDPVFRLVRLDGDVFVLRPNEQPVVDEETGREILPWARDQRAYPYGTRIVTGQNSSGELRFSRYSDAEFGANATLVVDEDSEDPRRKVVHLESGRLLVELEEGIEATGNSVTVQTPAALCVATNMTRFEVEVSEDVIGRTVTAITAKDGELRVYHPELFEMYFVAYESATEYGVNVLNSPDGNFVDIVGRRNTFGVKVRDPGRPAPGDFDVLDWDDFPEQDVKDFVGLPDEADYRVFEVTPNFTLKFSKRRVLDDTTLLVTILGITSEGEIVEEITYQEGAPEATSMDDAEEDDWGLDDFEF